MSHFSTTPLSSRLPIERRASPPTGDPPTPLVCESAPRRDQPVPRGCALAVHATANSPDVDARLSEVRTIPSRARRRHSRQLLLGRAAAEIGRHHKRHQRRRQLHQRATRFFTHLRTNNRKHPTSHQLRRQLQVKRNLTDRPRATVIQQCREHTEHPLLGEHRSTLKRRLEQQQIRRARLVLEKPEQSNQPRPHPRDPPPLVKPTSLTLDLLAPHRLGHRPRQPRDTLLERRQAALSDALRGLVMRPPRRALECYPRLCKTGVTRCGTTGA